ncbi:MAG: cell division ATP-binding protein FtsE [Gemmatimonadota bacterium]|nr:cell division ATP-binding protein FtsE [Gemmatimonadota bacterium]
MIKLDSVSKEYPRSGMVLKEVSFHIRKGELVFLTGHSGSGKSTILRLVQMADAPTAGEVRVSGFSSKRLRRREIPYLRRKVGMVFQEFRLLPGRTAEENIAFALEVTGTRRAAITQKVGRLMAQVGLAAKARAYPEELSGGERQRVAVARALANDPLVLLADEPTGNLDEWSARGIFQLFREINASGMTVLMATHDLDLVRSHPQYRVLELSAGELVYDSALEPAAQGG